MWDREFNDLDSWTLAVAGCVTVGVGLLHCVRSMVAPPPEPVLVKLVTESFKERFLDDAVVATLYVWNTSGGGTRIMWRAGANGLPPDGRRQAIEQQMRALHSTVAQWALVSMPTRTSDAAVETWRAATRLLVAKHHSRPGGRLSRESVEPPGTVVGSIFGWHGSAERTDCETLFWWGDNVVISIIHYPSCPADKNLQRKAVAQIPRVTTAVLRFSDDEYI